MALLVKNKSEQPLATLKVSNTVARDSRLSWKAKGIYMYLASLGDDNIHTAGEIESASNHDGRGSTRSAIKPLIKYGYLSRIWCKDYQYMWVLSPEPKC